jgi:predicted MPP superfamily phosphohydrolase
LSYSWFEAGIFSFCPLLMEVNMRNLFSKTAVFFFAAAVILAGCEAPAGSNTGAEDNNASPILAQTDSVIADNGAITIVLQEDPTTAPVLSHFIIKQYINGDTVGSVVAGLAFVSYSPAAKTVSLTFTPISGTNTQQSVVIGVEAAGDSAETKAPAFIITAAGLVTRYTKIGQTDLTPGQYIISISNITLSGGNGGAGVAAARISAKTTVLTDILDYQRFDGNDDESNTGILWNITTGTLTDTYTIQAVDKAATPDASYLNLSTAAVTLGTAQDLSISWSSTGFRITNPSNPAYYLRVTGSHGYGFYVGTNTNSSLMDLYKVEEVTVAAPFTPQGSLLYTIAATSDIHTDAGIQNNAPYIRGGMITTATAMLPENAKVLVLAGDLISDHISATGWTMSGNYTNAIQALYTTAASATPSGRTLYVTGNHDFAPGMGNWNSGDYTADMINKIGPFTHTFNQTAKINNRDHVLGYHYLIDGLNFVVLNTADIGADNHNNYVYDPGLITWVDGQLDAIGADKTAFVIGHYPFRDSRNISNADKGMNSVSDTALKAVMIKYPKVVYLYGHDHGGVQIHTDTFERITPYTDTGAVSNSRSITPTGFISSFVGSQAYYNDGLGGLDSTTPAVVQGLIVYIYSDGITFTMKNYGVSVPPGGVQAPASYSIPRTITLS